MADPEINAKGMTKEGQAALVVSVKSRDINLAGRMVRNIWYAYE